MNFSKTRAKQIFEKFLRTVRERVAELGLDPSRLPGWMRAAQVRVGWINDSLIGVFEEGPSGDVYEVRGQIDADTVALLDVENFFPLGLGLRAREAEGFIILVGEYREDKRVVFRMVDAYGGLFDCGYAGFHGPRALWNVFLEVDPPSGGELGPLATRFVPFALYLHKRDTRDLPRTWQKIEAQLVPLLQSLHDSAAGDYYAQLHGRFATFEMTKRTGVVILGKDSGKELQELVAVRDYLASKGYDSFLIRQLPEIPAMSTEEKVRLWAQATRFSVMVDRAPAGHIAEYHLLKEQRTILALLRPRGSGSTFMIGDDSLVDVNFIKVFEFEKTPLEVISPVIDWAEGVVGGRANAYDANYPWRKKEG